MKKPIFFKIFLGFLLITFIVSTLILLLSFKTTRDYHIETLSKNLKKLGITLGFKIKPLLEKNRIEELRKFVIDLSKNINTRITIIDHNGKVLADSEENPDDMENHGNRPEVIQALKGKFGKSLRYSTTVKEKMLYVAVPIGSDSEEIRVLRLSLFLKGINKLLAELKKRIIQVSLIAIFIALIGAAIFSKNLSNPIRELATASRKIASGNFKTKVFLKSKDELKELADNFNYMSEKIGNLFSQISLQKEELNRIISSIQEGLVVIDKEGKIILNNESFNKIVNQKLTGNEYYWEILRSPDLNKIINNVKERKVNQTKEIGLNQKTFLCNISYLEPKESIVLTFHDITEIKKLEEVKKDFVVNVSHELRTPLTSIKGYIETLQEETGKKHKHYLDIINRHTDRLINMVHDLMSLSELEETSESELKLEKVNLKDLFSNLQKIYQKRVEEKNLKLEIKIDKDLTFIKADPFKLEQAFMNLIDNAIKYTEEGKITISVTTKDKKIKFQIQDTGIGIPEEHLNRIFERFYVVDKSRSRKFGGTGLGLSIVKHIVMLHGGKIDVESMVGKGTTFTISLPNSS